MRGSQQEDKAFAFRMRQCVIDHHRMQWEQKAAIEKAARNERARRQFLMFLIFAILASSVLYKEEIDSATSAVFARVKAASLVDPRRATQANAEAQIGVVAAEAGDRLAMLDEIAPGLGANALDQGAGAAADGQGADPAIAARGAAKPELRAVAEASQRRKAILDQIVPGMGQGSGDEGRRAITNPAAPREQAF